MHRAVLATEPGPSVLRTRRLCVVALAALAALGGAGAWPAGASDGESSGVSVVRLGGADRYATSLLVAEAFAADAGGSLSSVVMVSGERWADAAVAVPVAGALGSPVLLTPPGELREDLSGFLQRVSVSEVVLVGPDERGADADLGRGVSAAVMDELGGLGISVERVAGSDPYTTSVAAARRITPGVMGSHGTTAVVASPAGLAEALVAGPFAARGVHPLLLTPPDRLHPDVAAYLADAGIEHVVVMGGTAVLSAGAESAIAAAGVAVTRVTGGTFYDTAAKTAGLVADAYSDAAGGRCFRLDTVGVARAGVPFDAISAAPPLGRWCAPLVLVDPERIPADAAALLDTARSANDTVTLQVFGGDTAISRAAVDAYLAGEDPIAGCRHRGAESVTAEFPQPDLVAPSTGTLRVAVLFMDFPNARSTYSTFHEAELGLPFMEEYLETVSYGNLDVEIEALHKWLRAPNDYGRYLRTTHFGRRIGPLAARQAVELADPEFDFSDFDVIMTVLPSLYFAESSPNGLVSADGSTMIMTPVNTERDIARRGFQDWLQRVVREWGVNAVHMIGHGFGLPDLFAFDGHAHDLPDAPAGMEWIAAGFGVMEFYSYFLEHESEMLLRRDIEWLEDGGVSRVFGYVTAPALRANEMLAWHRWQLGWLDESQVRCPSGTEASVTLAPIAQTDGRVAMVAIPLNAHEVIVVESRRWLGYDVDESFAGPQGETITFPSLLHEGVLVYTVDMLAPSGHLPMKIAGQSENGQVDGYPILEPGESVTVRGYTVTLDADTGNTHTVTVTPAE